jgi:hypothetical protein
MIGIAAVRPASRRKERRDVSEVGIKEEDDMAISCNIEFLLGLYPSSIYRIFTAVQRNSWTLAVMDALPQLQDFCLSEEPAHMSGPWGT